jgi:hypothetical protein
MKSALTSLQRQLSLLPQSLLILVVILYLVSLVGKITYANRVVTFTQDQARDVYLMERFAHEGKYLIGYGPKTSIGNFHLSPFYYQLHYFVSVLAQHRPLAMQWVVMLIESATPVFLFLLLLQLIKKEYAAGISLAYGLAPLPVIFSTFAWNPNLIPFCSTLALLCFLTYLQKKWRWLLPIGLVAIVLATHLHYQAAVLAPFLALFGLYTLITDRASFKYWLIGGVVAALTLVPYLLEENRHNWQNTQTMLRFFTQEHTQYYDRISKVDFVLSFIPGFLERVMVGANQTYLWIGRLVVVVGGALLGWLSLQNKHQERWLLIYFSSIFLMLRFFKGDKLDYYMSVLFIFPFILLGLIVHRSKLIGIPLILLVTFLAGRHLSSQPQINQLSQLKNTAEVFSSLIPEQEVNVIYHGDTFANLYAFGFSHYSPVKLNSQATVIADICKTKLACAWDTIPRCSRSRAYTFSALSKSYRKYTLNSSYIINDQFKVLIGQVTEASESSYFSQYSPHGTTYGSDVITAQ